MNNIDELYKKLLPLATDDYQNRDGDYPKSGVADSIDVTKYEISCSFKNTSCNTAKRWLYKYLTNNNFNVDEDSIDSYQDGDYDDDWVVAYVNMKHITKA